MTTIDQALSEFRDAWIAGRRPSLLDYVERVQVDDREELADAIHTWLLRAPEPDYDDAALAEISADPILAAALAAGEEAAKPFATRLRTLREHAGLAIEQLAERLTRTFGLAGQEQRTAEYLARAERSELDERGLSRRLIEGLASALGADSDALRPAWTSPAMAGHYRLDDDELDQAALSGAFDAASAAAMAPPPAAAMDDLDRLFRGGPQG